jgi:uncharacterized protein (TIGR03435 family)
MTSKYHLAAACVAAVAMFGPSESPFRESLTASAHSTAQTAAFDSAFISRNTSVGPSGFRLMPDGSVTAKNITLRELMQFAYQRRAFDRRQIEGGPAWIDSDRFDLEARSTRGHVFEADAFPRQTVLMLRALLEDRFKLKVRNDPRQMPVYALTVSGAETQSRLKKVDIDCGAIIREKVKKERERPNEMQAGRPVCAIARYQGRMIADAITMPALAGALSGTLDRVVIDRTGLPGSYELELEAVEIKAPGPLGPSARPSDTKQSIFAAMPEQLGLNLEATTGAVEVLVIERAELPAKEKQG